jgi:hypothetical protein
MASTTERMTFSVPAKLKRRAQKMRGVNWSGVVTKAIEDKLVELELMDRIASKSKLTLEDVDELADIVDKAMAKRLGVRR